MLLIVYEELRVSKKEHDWYKTFVKITELGFPGNAVTKEQRTKGMIQLSLKLHEDGPLLKNTMAICSWEIQWCLYCRSVLQGWLCILNSCDINIKNHKMVFDIGCGLCSCLMGLFAVTVHYVPSKRVDEDVERNAGCLFCSACCTLGHTRNHLQRREQLLPWQ